MTATDSQPAAMLSGGGRRRPGWAPPRQPHKAGATIYPSASSRTARSADPGPQAAWSRPRKATARPRTGRGDRQPGRFMPEPTTAYEPGAWET